MRYPREAPPEGPVTFISPPGYAPILGPAVLPVSMRGRRGPCAPCGGCAGGAAHAGQMVRVAQRRFGKELAPHVVQAWREYSRAFSEFPFHGGQEAAFLGEGRLAVAAAKFVRPGVAAAQLAGIEQFVIAVGQLPTRNVKLESLG